MLDTKMNATNHTREAGGAGRTPLEAGKTYLSLEDYDCIGFDLDHTLCRYNVGPMIRCSSTLVTLVTLTGATLQV